MNADIQRTLSTLEGLKQPDGNPYWNVSRDVGMFLNLMVKTSGAKRVLEVGTSSGYSGIFLAEALLDRDGELVTIESHKARYELGSQSFKDAGVDHVVTHLKGHAPEIFEEIEGGFDFVFFDATKKEHARYLKAILPRMSSGGIIITDNITSHAEVMNAYVEYAFSLEELESVVIPMGTGLLLSRVR